MRVICGSDKPKSAADRPRQLRLGVCETASSSSSCVGEGEQRQPCESCPDREYEGRLSGEKWAGSGPERLFHSWSRAGKRSSSSRWLVWRGGGLEFAAGLFAWMTVLEAVPSNFLPFAGLPATTSRLTHTTSASSSPRPALSFPRSFSPFFCPPIVLLRPLSC